MGKTQEMEERDHFKSGKYLARIRWENFVIGDYRVVPSFTLSKRFWKRLSQLTHIFGKASNYRLVFRWLVFQPMPRLRTLKNQWGLRGGIRLWVSIRLYQILYRSVYRDVNFFWSIKPREQDETWSDSKVFTTFYILLPKQCTLLSSVCRYSSPPFCCQAQTGSYCRVVASPAHLAADHAVYHVIGWVALSLGSKMKTLLRVLTVLLIRAFWLVPGELPRDCVISSSPIGQEIHATRGHWFPK